MDKQDRREFIKTGLIFLGMSAGFGGIVSTLVEDPEMLSFWSFPPNVDISDASKWEAIGGIRELVFFQSGRIFARTENQLWRIAETLIGHHRIMNPPASLLAIVNMDGRQAR